MATLITKNSSTASAVPAAGDLVKGELAVNVTDKKVYTKDNSAAVVKLVGSLGNQEANAVAVTGGTINGTTIGATTPSTGAFTTASASSGFTGNLTGNVTGNVSGTASNVTGVVAIANGGTGLSSLGTGVQSALGQAVTGSGSFVLSTSPSLTTPNLGTPSAAVLTNATGLPLTTGVTGTLSVANGGTGITAFGTGVATALGQNVTGSGGIVLATSPSLTTPNLGTPSAVTLTNATGLPISTGVSGLGTGVATALGVAVGSSGAFVTNGGALGTPSSGTVTNLTGTASININGTVGATTPTTGAFTTLSASGNITVSGGTANGVAYLNGSKVLTTGSALTFDGTNLTLTGPVIRSNTGIYFTGNTSGSFIWSTDAYPLRFGVNDSEQMRLTSTGLGIGTSSPREKLDVAGNIAAPFTDGSTIQFQYLTGSSYGLGMMADANNRGLKLFTRSGDGTGYIGFYTGGMSERMRLDYSGNLGLGVTPSAWSVIKALQIGAGYGASFYADNGSLQSGIATNAYYSSTGWKYFATNVASRFEQDGNSFSWLLAPSGTAGNAISFTQAMTLDASGNWMTGTTTAIGRATVVGGTSQLAFHDGNGSNTNYGLLNYGGSSGELTLNANSTGGNTLIRFLTSNSGSNAERARITSGGDLLVGTTSTPNGGSNFYVAGGGTILNTQTDSTGGVNHIVFRNGNGNVGSISTSGTATTYSTSSDYRLKNNQQPLTGSGTFIDALKPKTWNWTTDGSKGVGFIAHEVQEVSPGSVVGTKDAVDEEGKPIMQAMEYGSAEFIANIIAELQSLRARVAQLEAK